ncbi:HEAT repeat domain-containing protein [Listeria welshimeri]|uniref:HEAT repeat domain-containing protein n=1 Tax=Listeria welshimeri TaxID=1643 RepID=UPI001626173C|nr:HEAT repeat domain-containing protein [Listeria welshimeri]MBC1964997.1 HEAT repeat domain-containing protein [Listeria welshimeri]MBF2565435.1 HEAT repeat domain-containing protein [Listeria welshimeri]MBF2581121.1 HEAT repeat domain-containing protein [Listeria welshimeri]MBF2583941.1 HEAT repeat domain-containing protein [Listeria welshimeri]
MIHNDINYHHLIGKVHSVSDVDELSNILEELKEYPTNNQLEKLFKSYIDDESPLIRCIAFEGLAKSEFKDTEIAQKAIEHLNDEDIVVMSCIELLAEYEYLEAVPYIKNLLRHLDAGVRCTAAEALGDMNCKAQLMDIVQTNKVEVNDLAKVGQRYGIYLLSNESDEIFALNRLIELLYSSNMTASYRVMNNLIAVLNERNRPLIFMAFQEKLKEKNITGFKTELEDNLKALKGS